MVVLAVEGKEDLREKIFKECDRNEDERLDRDEFRIFVAMMFPKCADIKMECEALQGVFGVDKDQEITKAAILQFLDSIPEDELAANLQYCRTEQDPNTKDISELSP